MGKLLPSYKYGLIEEMVNNIAANNAQYYAFAANPVPSTGNTEPTHSDDYDNLFTPSWHLMFGKKIANTDIMPVIKNNPWVSNTVYTRYNNTRQRALEIANTYSNTNYYTIVSPSVSGGAYHVYICIDNNNGEPSTSKPDKIQPSTFQTADNYMWRYVTSIPNQQYNNFATIDYIPIGPNNQIVSGAFDYCGVDVIVLEDANGAPTNGSGYITYHDGIIQSVSNSTLIEISNTASFANGFYVNNGIYLFNNSSSTGQYFEISRYISNVSSGVERNWVYLDSAANTLNIIPGVTQYKISPKVIFETDGDSNPIAYSVINTVANSVNNIVIVDTGYGITWANVTLQSNSYYPLANSGHRANAYAIIAPSGGHGSNIYQELQIEGLALNFTFANTEYGKIITNCRYNKVGILKNPHNMIATVNASYLTVINKAGTIYSNSVFNQILIANVSPANTLFTVGDTVFGQTSTARGTVVFSNSTQIGLTGDKNFIQQETIVSSNGSVTANIYINTFGSIYTKDLNILYTQNIADVQRSNLQSETYKLIIQV